MNSTANDVLTVLLKDIDKAIQYYQYRQSNCITQKELPLSRLSPKARKLFDKLLEADKVYEAARTALGRAKVAVYDELKKVNGIELGQNANRYLIRETHEAAFLRTEGGKEKIREKLNRLHELRDQLILAAASNDPLAEYAREIKELTKGARGDY